MSETLGDSRNHPTRALSTLYDRWAHGGAGLLITGNVMIDSSALGETHNVVIENPQAKNYQVENKQNFELLRNWALAGTQNNTQLWMQLNHPGKQAPRSFNSTAVAPSAIPFQSGISRFFHPPKELAESEIENIISRFGVTAEIAKRAGFTGVQIHGAHGYLVSQFLSPLHNQRRDKWGGNAQNRRRFAIEVFKEIRRKVGPRFPIGIKLNSADFQKGGLEESESMGTISALSEMGIDLIEISGGTYEAPVALVGTAAETRPHTPQKESTRKREAYFLEFAQKARTVAPLTPLMLTGGFRTSAVMAEAIASGAVDVIGLARLLAVEPDAPLRFLEGSEAKHHVRPIRTGIKYIDQTSVMEITWYNRQMRRLSAGKDPRPNESALCSLLHTTLTNGCQILQKRRLRA